MKICTLQTIICLTLCSLAVAHDNYAQVLDKKITISLKEVSIEQALESISNLTNVKFFYSVDQLDIIETVSLRAIDRSLRDVLDEILTPLHIQYKVHEKKSTITLKKRQAQTKSDVGQIDGQIPHAGPSYPAGIVTGKVTDAATTQPIAGVNIIIKGTTEGTTTDSQGEYSIWAGDTDILVFSFIGFATVEIPVNGNTVIDVPMVEDIKSLKEVEVNAGYYRTSKTLGTGNIAKISSKEIQKQPVSNSLAALQGRVTGLEITQTTGVPGGNFKVRIRGTNSIANGNEPLYIIDGVPYFSSSMSFLETSGNILGNPNPAAGQGSSPLNSINPSDIESIEVLKDADATAIYGSRGSNGVILITTKRGSPGKTKIDFNFYSGAGKVGGKVDLLETQQYIEMRKEGIVNDGYSPYYNNPAYSSLWRDLKVWDTTRYTNWQHELLGGTARTSDMQLNISGGDEHTQFAIGGATHSETTVFPGDNSDRRISSHVNVTNTSSDKRLKTSLLFNYSVIDTDLIKEDLTRKALSLPPNAPALFDEAGKLSWVNWSQTFENPLAFLNRKYEATTTNFIGNTIIAYNIFPSLEAKANFGYTLSTSKAVTTTPLSSLDPATAATAQNRASFSDSNFKNWIVEPQLNWAPKFRSHTFQIMIGTTFLHQTTEGLAQDGSGFSSEALIKNLASATNRSAGTNYYSQYRYHAAFGRINYIQKDKYIINLTARRDGSSRFGPGKQFANFGAIGLAWIFSEENWTKKSLPFLSYGKLRASYGTTGNDQLGNYQYLDSYTSSFGTYQGIIGLAPARLSNPDFAWETNRKFEAGLELGFWNNRILSTASYYLNRSSDQLIGYPLPPTTGFSSIQGNFPAVVENTGIEIELTAHNVVTNDFTWLTSLNLTIPRNKLIKFPDLEASPNYANTYIVGQPLSIRQLYHHTGIDPVSGTYTFEDVNGDGNYDFDDRKTAKFVGQNFYGGFQNNFNYKGLELDVFFQFVRQSGFSYLYLFDYAPGIFGNQPSEVMDRWTAEGATPGFQRFTYSTNQTAYSRYISSDQLITDASFIRLKNISLSYSLPPGILQPVKIVNARIFIQGQNLLILTNYKGLDPETQSNSLPPLRVLTAGISLTL